jgi:CubicO group peptidase (beta-lactamase class C family)
MWSLLLPIALSLTGMTPPLGLAQATTPLAARVQSAAKFYWHRDGFMGMVGVQGSHHLVYGAGFGYANVQRQIRLGMTTRFRIGSISKQITAAGSLLRSDSKGLSAGFKRTHERTAIALKDRAKHPWMR